MPMQKKNFNMAKKIIEHPYSAVVSQQKLQIYLQNANI